MWSASPRKLSDIRTHPLVLLSLILPYIHPLKLMFSKHGGTQLIESGDLLLLENLYDTNTRSKQQNGEIMESWTLFLLRTQIQHRNILTPP
jgi:hypothetical protein